MLVREEIKVIFQKQTIISKTKQGRLIWEIGKIL